MSILKNLNKGINLPTILLASSMFFTGASGFVIQNILSVTASSILGNSFVQFGVTISLMLGSMGIGGALQKYIQNNLLEKFVLIEMALVLLTAFAPIGLYSTYVVMPEHFTLIQYSWIIFVGLLIGFEIPLISRINEKYQPQLHDNLASIVTMDYVGSMAGGIIWTFFFLGRLDISTSAFITASLNMGVALVTYGYFVNLDKKKKDYKIIGVIVACGIIIITSSFLVNKWQVDLQQRLFEDRIVLNKTTKYQNLVLTHDKQLDDYRLYINGNLQFSSLDEKIYHEHLVHPVMNISEQVNNVLVLGGGDGMAVRELLKYKDIKNITLVDLDKDMIDICTNNPVLASLNDSSFHNAKVRTGLGDVKPLNLKKNLFMEEDIYNPESRKYDQKFTELAEVNVFTIDAYSFVKDYKDKIYDVVIIDFPDPSVIELNKLYSKEFFLHLKSIITPNTKIAIQSTSPYHAKDAFLCIGRTMESVGFKTLPYHHNVPSFGDWGWYIAWQGGVTPDQMNNRISSIDEFQVEELSYLTPSVLKSSLSFGKNTLKTDKEDINTLLNPVLLSYYINKGWKIE